MSTAHQDPVVGRRPRSETANGKEADVVRTKGRGLRFVIVLAIFALVAAACSSDDDSGGEGGGDETFTLGVSNTLVGNAWREQMICAIKAEALARGNVDEVVLQNANTDAAGQIAQIQTLISQGVDAILINPADREALNAAIEEASEQGIPVISIDTSVTAPSAYYVANDQTAYGELGARWLFEALGGEGRVAYMRGLEGHPADVDRDTGFQAALEGFPNIEIVYEDWTGWDPTTGAQQALEFLTTMEVDGIWTSGIDYTVVEQFSVAGVNPVPVVGADNNAFLEQLYTVDGLTGVGGLEPTVDRWRWCSRSLSTSSRGTDVSAPDADHPGKRYSDPAEAEEIFVEDLPAGWSAIHGAPAVHELQRHSKSWTARAQASKRSGPVAGSLRGARHPTPLGHDVTDAQPTPHRLSGVAKAYGSVIALRSLDHRGEGRARCMRFSVRTAPARAPL